VMIMETDDARFDPQRMAEAESVNPPVREWEALMWRFQVGTPWTGDGVKWTPMKRIFDLREYGVPTQLPER
jgi:L-rhamnose mutarotase